MPLRLLSALLAAVLLAVGLASSAAAADRAFAPRFSSVGNGDLTLTGNTVLTCSGGGCSASRDGSSADAASGQLGMTRIDIDGIAGTETSSRATVTVPSGATVLWAGLYWGGVSSATDAQRRTVKLATPTVAAYADIAATQFDTATSNAQVYQGFADVTAAVSAGGSGVYTVANVRANTGDGQYGGWSIAVAYRDATAARKRINVLDGFASVAAATPQSVALTGLTPPATGTIAAELGLVAYDGDRSISGETVKLQGTDVTNTLNPPLNALNSSITRTVSGVPTRITAKTPDYVDQLGFDVDAIAANGQIAAGATSATVNFTSSGDVYYPGLVSIVTDSEVVAPETTITAGPSGSTNDDTPTFAFSSNEAGSTFECRVDGGAWSACTSPFTPPALAEGSHTFEVRATDTAANVDPTPATRTIVVDTVAPQTTITASPSSPTNDPTATFSFSADQAGSTFECRVDGGAWTACSSPATTATLTDGVHTVEIRAIDAAGNVDQTPASRTITVDTAAPDTTITSGPSGATNDTTPTFAFSAEAGASFECRVDGGAWSSCTSPHTTAALAQGPHSFEVRAVDAAGNVDATPATRSIVVDTAAPATTITSGPSGATNDPTLDYAFSSSEAGSTFECSLDGAAFSPCSSPFASASLPDGSHSFRVRAIDAAGNVDAAPATRTVAVDTVAPQTTITASPTSPTNDNTATFSFSSDEAGASFACSVDGAAFSPCSSALTTATLADGSHTFAVRAIDAAGNVDASPATRTIVVDTVRPQTTIIAEPSSPTNDATATFSFSSDEAGSTFECSVDGAAFSSCTSPATTASLADGIHTFAVRAIDAAGNTDDTPASRSFTVDTNPPQTTITGGPSGATNDATPSFTFASDEPGSSFACRVDGAAFAPCSSPKLVALLADGPHSFEVQATDAAGNVDLSPAVRTITVDTEPPSTTITASPTSPTNDPTASISFASNEAGSRFECSVDGGAFTACSSPETTSSLTDGSHTFRVHAIDPAGNVDASPATRTFTVDTGAPQTSIASGPSGPTNDQTPTFVLSSDEAGSSFECRVDGGPWSACSSPETTTALGQGAHTFETRATDAAGNVDASPASRTFTVDTDTPGTTITSGPSGPTNDPTPTYAFVSDEPGASFECRLDGGAWATCSSPTTTAALADGEHTFEVRAVDAAGNVDAVPAIRTVTVDTVAPQTTIVAAPASPTSDATATFSFTSSEPGSTFACSVDGAAYAPCTSPETTTTLGDGEHTFRVHATDAAGNLDGSPATSTIVVDTRAPQTTITAAPTSPTNDPTASFAFASDEPGSSFECSLDGAAYTACTSPLTTAALPDGPHTFAVRATDAAANTDQSPARATFTVDTTAPQTTITAGPSGPTADATPQFALASDEPGSTFECRVGAAAFAPCASPELLATLPDGTYTFEVRAIDAAGNVDPIPASHTFTVDTEAPATTIVAAPASPTNDATATFSFASDESGASFECRVDGGAFAPCSSPHTTTALSEGTHTFAVRATDAAGNVDQTPAEQTLTVDLTAPQTTITAGPSGPSNAPAPQFSFAADQAGSSFECRLDGGAWLPCSSPETLSVSGGAHTFEVRATDPAGNVDPSPASRSFTKDTNAPGTTITSGPSGATNDATLDYTFTSDEAGSTFTCSLDGAPFTSCSSPFSSAPLDDGPHSFAVRATDAAGNVDSAPAVRSVIVDTAAPQTTFTDAPAADTDDPTPSFSFASDAGTTFECRLDGGAWVPCTSPRTTAPLGDGPHSFEVRATDAAGNREASPATRSFTVDTAAPQTTLTDAPSGTIKDPTPTFAFDADQAGSRFECRLDGGAWTACASPRTVASLDDGPHSFEVRAIDPAGNVDATPAAATFTVDTTVDTGAPQTTIDSGPSGPTSDTTPTYAFSSDEPGSTFECRVDAEPFAMCASPFTTLALGDGEHTFEVRATDAAGNVDPLPAIRTIVVDTVAPQSTVTGPSGVTNDPTPSFTFTAQAGSTFACSVDGAAPLPCSSPLTLATLGDGPHTLSVVATDPAGNVEAAPTTRSFTVDTDEPQTTILTGPSGAVADPTPTFSFGSDEPGSRFECAVDAGAFTACTSPTTLTALGQGNHTFSVRAIDAAGNPDGTPASQSFTVDTDEPGTSITSGPSGPTGDATLDYVFTADEPGSTFECSVDDAPFTGCSSPFASAPLADGTHRFRVRAIDAAGNVDSIPSQRTVLVDTVAPQTTIDAAPATPTNDPTLDYAFSSDTPGAHFECAVDAGPFTACTSPKATAALADGTRTIRVRAIDPAGNVDQTPAERTVVVDTDDPQTTIDDGPPSVSKNASATFSFSSDEAGGSFACAIDGGRPEPCTSPLTVTLADGTHTFEVVATDAAGNADPSPAVRTVVIDTAAPQTEIDSGPSGATKDATPTYAFSSSEPTATLECRFDEEPFAPCASPFTAAALTDGVHTFEVRAVDAAGNPDSTPASRTITVDTTVDATAPQTTITAGPSGAITDTTPVFSFSSDEAASSFECRIDTGAWVACTSPETVAELADGEHTFAVRATDAAGNTDQTPATRSFTVDTDAPQTEITTGPTGPTSDATPTFGLSSDESGSTFECRVDDAPFAACTAPHTTAGLSQGEHTFEVVATDVAGNRDTTPAARTFVVDTDTPGTTITAGPSGTTNDQTPRFTFTSDEPGATFACSVDGAAFSPCTSPFTATELGEGDHTFRVRAVDAAGNVDDAPALREFTVDVTAPQTTITAAPASPTRDDTPTFAFSAGEPGSTFECRIDEGAFSPCTSPETTAQLADGEHSFAVRATDPAGNTDGSPAVITLRIDTRTPETTIVAATPSPTKDTTPSFSFTADEPGATFTCRIDGGPWSSCPSPEELAPLADGTHLFEVRATDAAGNDDPTPAARTIVVDTQAPQTTITLAPSTPTSDTTPEVSFASSQAGSTFECRLDGGAWSACASPETLTLIDDGSFLFEVRATDAAGNVDGSPARQTIVLDTAAPETEITSAPSGPTRDATPSFGFRADEPGSTFECRVDGDTFRSCSSPEATRELSDGTHTFEVRATDAAGNRDGSPASRTVTVDTRAPQTAITSGPSPTTNATTPSFAFSSDEPGSSFECSLDGGAFVACASPYETTALDDGEHRFAVRAIDAAGNVDPTPASRTFTVDTDAPQTTIVSGPSGATKQRTPTYAFTSDESGATFECRLDGAAWRACSSPYAAPSLGDGPHTFEVRAVDAAGNVDAVPAVRALVVDNVEPPTTILTGPQGTTDDATASFTFSSDEPGASFECRVDDGDWVACVSPRTTAALANGSHTFEVRAVDDADNVDQTPASRTFTVAVVTPQTTIVSGPPSVGNDPRPRFAFTSADAAPGATFECRIDGGAWSDCPSPFVAGVLADGEHTFEARVKDVTEETSPTPALRRFTIDTAASQTQITSGPPETTDDATPTFDLVAEEAGSTFECRVDGGPWNACGATETTAPLADGSHTFESRAVDAAGNRDQTPASRSFTVDRSGPQTDIADGPTDTTEDPTPTFTLTADEPGSSFECRVDDGPWAPCASPHTTASLSDGRHVFQSRATDRLGNVDPTPSSRTFTVARAVVKVPSPPAVTPQAPAPPDPELTPADEDLGALPGSLVSAARCAQVVVSPSYRRTNITGVGAIRLRVRSAGLVAPEAPVLVTLDVPAGKLKRAGLTLDKRKLTARPSRKPAAGMARGDARYTVKLLPAALTAAPRHVLRARITPRKGKSRTLTATLRTARCATRLTAGQWATAKGTGLRLRLDSLRAVSGVRFSLPRGFSIKAARKAFKLGRVKLVTGGPKTRTLTLTQPARRRSGTLLKGKPGQPAVSFGKSGITVRGLPARTGIVELTMYFPKAPAGPKLMAKNGKVTFKAQPTAVGGGRVAVVKTRLRSLRAR